MATLGEQIEAVKRELEINKNASKIQQYVQEYELIFQQLNPWQDALSSMLSRYRLLNELPADAPQKMTFSEDLAYQAEKCMTALTIFIQKWKKDKHLARQGGELAIAADSLNALRQNAETAIKDCWNAWIDHVQQAVALESVRLESQKNIPGQEAIYREFIQCRSDLKKLTSTLVSTKEDIANIQRLKERMVILRAEMKFDLPQFVTDFFRELDRCAHKIPLNKLSLEVFQWLQENGQLDKFMIESRTRGKF